MIAYRIGSRKGTKTQRISLFASLRLCVKYDLYYSWGGRLLAFCLLLSLIQPAPILITPGPPRTVHTTHPIVSVHTRLTDEVEEWKIQRTLQMVREMGATTIVEFFPWAYYHAEHGGFAWEDRKSVV